MLNSKPSVMQVEATNIPVEVSMGKLEDLPVVVPVVEIQGALLLVGLLPALNQTNELDVVMDDKDVQMVLVAPIINDVH